jgi:hypothetical protein
MGVLDVVKEFVRVVRIVVEICATNKSDTFTSLPNAVTTYQNCLTTSTDKYDKLTTISQIRLSLEALTTVLNISKQS